MCNINIFSKLKPSVKPSICFSLFSMKRLDFLSCSKSVWTKTDEKKVEFFHSYASFGGSIMCSFFVCFGILFENEIICLNLVFCFLECMDFIILWISYLHILNQFFKLIIHVGTFSELTNMY